MTQANNGQTKRGYYGEYGGRFVPERMAELLAGCNRSVAGPTSPSSGLTFIGPRYEARWGLPAEVSQ